MAGWGGGITEDRNACGTVSQKKLYASDPNFIGSCLPTTSPDQFLFFFFQNFYIQISTICLRCFSLTPVGAKFQNTTPPTVCIRFQANPAKLIVCQARKKICIRI